MTTTPTLYEWAGGHEALLRLTQVFYDKVLSDPVLAPVFAHMGDKHREHAAAALAGWRIASAVPASPGRRRNRRVA